MRELGLSLAAQIAFLVCAMALFRLFEPRRIMAVLVGTFVCVYVVALVLIAAFMTGVDFWSFSIFLVCFFVCFVQIFAVFYKSISLRLAWDVSLKGRETLDQVYDASIVSGSFLRRIAALEEGGIVARRQDTIELTPKGHAVARRILVVQSLLGIENSG
jgi:hypothetical protein